MIGSFTEVKPLFYWVQHILPLVYDDSLSYMELLGKVTKTLNELVENNNLLPDYIMKLIKEYISSGEIEKVLAEVLANYMLNVKFPPKGLTPAVGDGSADDTEAIQGCINYAYQNGGMAVYFPSGAYLTQPLTLNEKVTLFGQDRYTTRIVMKGGATKPLFTGTVDEMSLTGLGFDGNMDIQVNNVNLFTITVNSAIITNCLLTDGYDLLNITVNNELQLDNILFRHAVENALVVGGAGYVQGDNLIFKSLSTLIGKNYIVLNTNKSILEEVKCFGAAPNGVLIGGNSNVVNMWCEACQTPYVDNGTNNTIHVYGASEDEKFTGDVTQYIGGFLNQTVVATKKLVSRNVIDTAGGTRQESTTGNKTETVNGNDTETVGGDKKETVSGSKSVIVTRSLDENIGTNKISVIKGTNTETITGLSTENANGGKALISTDYNENVINRNITAAKIEETLTGNKTVTAANITETVSGDRTINGGDITHTGDNITTHAKVDLDEQTDGNKVMRVTGTINETTGAKTENVNGAHTETVTGAKSTTAGTVDLTATNGETHRGKRMSILNTDPLQYSKPAPAPDLSKYFDYVPMLDVNNVGYKVIASNDLTKKLDDLLEFYYADVVDFGADPTGATDSTAAVQAALDSNASTIVFPAGTYLVTWAKIPSNKHVIGYGAKITTNGNIIFANKADGVTGGWSANRDITIEGFEVFAPNPVNCTPFGFGHATHVTVKNCVFHDIQTWHFIEFNSCKGCIVDNCYFYNYGTAAGGYTEMIQLDYALQEGVFPWFGPYDQTPTQDTKIVNCSFVGNSERISGHIPAAIGNHTSSTEWKIIGTEIANCYFENMGSCLKFVLSANLIMTGCYANNCENGVYMGGTIYGTNINNNFLVGRSDWEQTGYKRGIFIEWVNSADMTMIIGNTVANFGSHGVTCQGRMTNGFNNHIVQNGCNGLYVGWNDAGSKYSDNICWGNNMLAPAENPFYDFRLRLTRQGNFPAETAIGDFLISNNKFSSAGLTNDNVADLGAWQKGYFVMNFCKYTYINQASQVCVAGNNWLNWSPVETVQSPTIGTTVQFQPTEGVPFTAKGWVPIISGNVPVAGLWEFIGFIAIGASPRSSGLKGSVRIGKSRNSFEVNATAEEQREVYCEVSIIMRMNANDPVSLEVWATQAGAASATTCIFGTKIAD